jgi:hypothetical protein
MYQLRLIHCDSKAGSFRKEHLTITDRQRMDEEVADKQLASRQSARETAVRQSRGKVQCSRHADSCINGGGYDDSSAGDLRQFYNLPGRAQPADHHRFEDKDLRGSELQDTTDGVKVSNILVSGNRRTHCFPNMHQVLHVARTHWLFNEFEFVRF